MTDEEVRALAYQDSMRHKAAYRRQLAMKLRGSPSAYHGLWLRTKAIRGEVAQNDDRQDRDQGDDYRGSL